MGLGFDPIHKTAVLLLLPSSSSVNWYSYSVVVVWGFFVVAFVVGRVVLV